MVVVVVVGAVHDTPDEDDQLVDGKNIQISINIINAITRHYFLRIERKIAQENKKYHFSYSWTITFTNLFFFYIV